MVIDARVPVLFAPEQANGRDAWLLEGDAPAPAGVPVSRFVRSPHVFGCACCTPRGPAATALDRLFLARVRGEVAWFDRVAVSASAAGMASVRAALANDPLVRARFRYAGCLTDGTAAA